MKSDQLKAFVAEAGGPIKPPVLVQSGKPFDEKTARNIGDQLGVDWNVIPFDEWLMGMNEELEHADLTMGDPLQTGMIALVHLKERPDYYTVLKAAMEG